MKLLKTDRLVMRPWKVDDDVDAHALFKYARDPLVGLMAGWPPHSTIEESAQTMTTILSAEESYAITLRDNDDPIGSIALKPVSNYVTDALSGQPNTSEWNSIVTDTAREVGYWVGRPFWGKGIATEALRALMEHSFLNLYSTCIWGVHYNNNISSAAVLTRCGFRPVCQYANAYYPLIDAYHDTTIRAITPREWVLPNRVTQ